MPANRLYNLVAINERTGAKTVLTRYPDTHATCCTMKSKFSYHPSRRIQLEEVTPLDALESLIKRQAG